MSAFQNSTPWVSAKDCEAGSTSTGPHGAGRHTQTHTQWVASMGCQGEAWKTDSDSWVTSNMPASIKLYKQWEWGHCREICLTSEQLWGKGMGKTQWCQTRDRPAHSRLWGGGGGQNVGRRQEEKKGERGAGKRGCWWRWFSKEELVTTTLRAMNGKGRV